MVTPIFAFDRAFGHQFDGPELAWQLVSGRTEARLLAHETVAGGSRSRADCERIVIAAPAGQSALVARPIAPIAVLDELTIGLWVKSNRPDVQLAARVALPRSVDAQGAAKAVLIRGTNYSRPGQWQQLSLAGVPKLLAAEVRIMRSGTSATIDPREAYVEAVVLLVPGAPNGVEVFSDELDVDGVALPQADGVHLANLETTVSSTSPQAKQDTPRVQGIRSSTSTPDVRLQGSLLLVEGKPFLPRAIEWQGEGLEFLAAQGFNVIRLPSPPTTEQAAEAVRNGLWFVCTAPKPGEITARGLGQPGDRVLGWLFDDAGIEENPEYGRNWAELIRERDAVSGRPILIAPEAEWESCSKMADIVVARHPRFGVMPAADCDQWLESRAWLARAGVPLWTCIPTQYGDQVQQQAIALAEGLAAQQQVDTEQIAMLCRAACARGTRGVFFASASPLDEENPQALQRAAALQLINRYLALVEPWLAAGKVINRIDSSHQAWSGVVLHVDRTRLLIPLQVQTLSENIGASAAATPASRDEIAFVVPGVPESSQVYLLSPIAFRPLPVRRVAGGTRILVPASAENMLLITEDPQVVQSFRQRVARDGPSVAQLARTLAERRAASLTDTGRRLVPLGYSSAEAVRTLELANTQLRQCNGLIASGRIESAHQLLDSVNLALDHTADEQRRLIKASQPIVNHPLAMSLDGLADFARFWKSYPTLRGGENLLYGGDFEDLGQMAQFGWQHMSHPTQGVKASARLSTNDPKHGAYCLEMFASATAPNSGRVAVASAPIWIVSPPVPVEKDQVIEIAGWVRINEPIDGSIDGLQIADTLGGGELSLAIRQTSGWEPFHMIRGAPNSTELRLTFALTGLGSASIDGVMVRRLEQPIARRLPGISPAVDSTSTNTAEYPGPLFVAPGTR